MLYLVQHGEALTKDQDPERPLTEQGASDCRRLGHFLSRVEVTVDGLFHSGKLRARQSAKILGGYLASQEAPSSWRDSRPTARLSQWLRRWGAGRATR